MAPATRSSVSPAINARSNSSRSASLTNTKRPSSSTPSSSPRKVQKVEEVEPIETASLDDDDMPFDEAALLEVTLAAEEEKKIKTQERKQEALSKLSAKASALKASEKEKPTTSNVAPSTSDSKLKVMSHGDPSVERETMDPTWYSLLEGEMRLPYFTKLKLFLREQKTEIYPPAHLMYSWSRLTPLNKIKIVVVGQDPYHGPGQANGLAFSVFKGVGIPPSLINMYKELGIEYGSEFKKPTHGCLDGWASQGVLMLNSSQTVSKGEAGSHRNQGWEDFTRKILQIIVKEASHGQKASIKTSKIASMFSKVDAGVKEAVKEEQEKSNSQSSSTSSSLSKGIVFFAWGSSAQKAIKEAGITDATPNVLILKSVHPSPLSAHRGFIGCGHFKKANEWLEAESRYGKGGGINWNL